MIKFIKNLNMPMKLFLSLSFITLLISIFMVIFVWFFSENVKQNSINNIKNIYITDDTNISERSVALIKNQSNYTKTTFIIVICVALLILIIVYFIISRVFSRPIKHMESVTNRWNDGDLTLRLDYNSKDELGKSAYNLNKFIINFSDKINNIKVLKNKVYKNPLDNKETSIDSNLSFDEIKENVNTIEKKIDNIDKEIALSNNSVKKLKEFFLNVINLIRFQASTIKASSKSIEGMAKSVTRVAQMLDEKIIVAKSIENMAIEGEEEMRQTIKMIKKVSDSTGSITRIIELIDDVADQTNILAMNASIQSAQAGEFGKTFHVVANEIRKLANTTGSHSVQISEKLEDILEYIKSSKHSSEEAGGFFTSMVFGIGELSMSMNDVKSEMNKLLQESNSVTGSLSSLVQITEEVKKSSNEVESRVEDITNLIKSLNIMSAESKKEIEEIINNTNKIYQTFENIFNIRTKNLQDILELEKIIKNYKLIETIGSPAEKD